MNVQDIPPQRRRRLCQRGAASTPPPRCWPSASRDIPDDFLAKLFGLAVPEDLRALHAPTSLPAIAEQSWSFLAERASRRCQNTLRAVRRAARHIGARNRQRRHAVPRRFRRRRTQPARPRYSPVRSSGVRRRARRRGPAAQFQRRAHGRRRARKLHPPPCRRRGRCGAARRDRPTRSKASSPTCASACRIGSRCWRGFAASSPT